MFDKKKDKTETELKENGKVSLKDINYIFKSLGKKEIKLNKEYKIKKINHFFISLIVDLIDHEVSNLIESHRFRELLGKELNRRLREFFSLDLKTGKKVEVECISDRLEIKIPKEYEDGEIDMAQNHLLVVKNETLDILYNHLKLISKLENIELNE